MSLQTRRLTTRTIRLTQPWNLLNPIRESWRKFRKVSHTTTFRRSISSQYFSIWNQCSRRRANIRWEEQCTQTRTPPGKACRLTGWRCLRYCLAWVRLARSQAAVPRDPLGFQPSRRATIWGIARFTISSHLRMQIRWTSTKSPPWVTTTLRSPRFTRSRSPRSWVQFLKLLLRLSCTFRGLKFLKNRNLIIEHYIYKHTHF